MIIQILKQHSLGLLSIKYMILPTFKPEHSVTAFPSLDINEGKLHPNYLSPRINHQEKKSQWNEKAKVILPL